MAFVPVPKDLNRVKTKVMFNLTKRQLICFSVAAAVGVPIFFLAKAHLDLSTAAMLMVVIMLPFIFFALYEKDGQPAEKYLYHIVQSMFIRDKVRPYRTNNLYAEIQQKIKEQEELQLEQQHSKGKAYGYRKDPENKNHLLIDPETAPIVVQIFQWRAEGVSYMGINKKLNDAGILSPSQLKRERGVETNFNKKDRVILWNKHMITEILQNIVYIGHLAQKKGSQCLYGGIPYHITSEDEWIIAKNTHEPLLSEELFEKVQEINRAAVERTRANSGKYDHLPKAKNIYGKKFVCAECGAIMKLQRSISTKKDKVYFTFKCPTYAEHGTRGCSDVKIRKQDLDDAVFSFIKSQMEVFLDMEKTLHSLLAMKKVMIKQDNTVQEIRTLRQKLAQKQSLLSGMYVDLKEGLLSDAEYSHHKEIVMEDIRAIERNLSELEAPKNQTEEQITGEMKWKQLIRRFHDATEISEEMTDAFIETMKIHENGTLEIKLSYMDEFAALTKTCEKIRKEVA